MARSPSGILKLSSAPRSSIGQAREAVVFFGTFFPKAKKLGYLMINRASVQMWGIVGPSAGRPKWAGKKNDCVPAHENDCVPVHTIRFSLHKEFRAAGIRFSLHKEFGAAGIRFYLHKRYILKTCSRCAGFKGKKFV